MAAAISSSPQLHPLAAHAHQRLLQTSQSPQLGEPQRVVTERRLPTDVAQAVEPDDGRRSPVRPRPRFQSEAQASPRRAPPRRRQHAEAGLLQHRRALVEERQHAGRVDRLFRWRRGGQGRAERRDDPGRQSQAAQEVLVGVHHVVLQRGQLGAVRPHGRCGEEQTRVVHCLKRELDPPVTGAPGARWARQRRRRDRRRVPSAGAGSESRSVPQPRPCPQWRARHGVPRRAARGRGRGERRRPGKTRRPSIHRRRRRSMVVACGRPPPVAAGRRRSGGRTHR